MDGGGEVIQAAIDQLQRQRVERLVEVLGHRVGEIDEHAGAEPGRPDLHRDPVGGPRPEGAEAEQARGAQERRFDLPAPGVEIDDIGGRQHLGVADVGQVRAPGSPDLDLDEAQPVEAGIGAVLSQLDDPVADLGRGMQHPHHRLGPQAAGLTTAVRWASTTAQLGAGMMFRLEGGVWASDDSGRDRPAGDDPTTPSPPNARPLCP